MRYTGVVVIISLLLYNRVTRSKGSFLTEKIIGDNRETILQKFFVEVTIHLEHFVMRHMTIFGASNDQLETAQPLFEAFPLFVGTDAKTICNAKEFSEDTIVVNFLSTLKKVSLRKVFENLSHCGNSRFYLILEDHSGTELRDIDKALRLTFERTTKLPLLLHHDYKKDFLKIYGYAKGDNCSRKTKLIMDWTPGDGFEILRDWYDNYSPFAGCTQTIATKHHPPRMELDEHAKGGIRIEGGFEGKIILELAKKMNFTPVVQNFTTSGGDKKSLTKDIISSIAADEAIVGIAHIRPTESVSSAVAISSQYGHECVIWCVPRITRWKASPFFSEFSWITWICICAMFLASFAIERIARNTRHLNRVNVRKPDWVRIMLDIVGVTLGNPIIYRPLSLGSKVLLIIYICYSMVMTTAYKTSLFSMLTVGNVESTIVDAEGIVKANLTTGGHPLTLAILEDQKNESEWIPELIKRYVIETNTSQALRRISNDQDFAYLTTRSELEYHKEMFRRSGEQISFDVLDGCVLKYTTVAVTDRYWKSVSMELYRLLNRLSESGILAYWKQTSFKLRSPNFDTTETASTGMMNTWEELRRFSWESIYFVFLIYCTAMAIYILVFLMELIIHKYKSTRKVRRLNNLNLLKIKRRPPL